MEKIQRTKYNQVASEELKELRLKLNIFVRVSGHRPFVPLFLSRMHTKVAPLAQARILPAFELQERSWLGTFTPYGGDQGRPPQRTILQNINLSFFPGAKIGVWV